MVSHTPHTQTHTNTCTHAHTHAHTHTRAHAHAHTFTHTITQNGAFDVRKEAGYCVANVCAGGGGCSGVAGEIEQAAKEGAIRAYLDLVASR